MDDNPIAVYRLQKIADDKDRLYDGFAFVDESSLLGNRSIYNDFMPASREWDWEPPRLAKIWKPRAVHGERNPENDYPEIGLQVPAFSQRAVDRLGRLLSHNGELLALVCDLGEYFAYNVTRVAEAMDPEGSEVFWAADAAWAQDVDRYEFLPDRLRGLTIFRPREQPNVVLATNVFLEAVRAAKLKGMSFQKLWPLPSGQLWIRRRPVELR